MQEDDIENFQSKAWAFALEEDGAVTVDWVVLTAGIVGMAALSAAAIKDATGSLAGTVSNNVSNTEVSNGD